MEYSKQGRAITGSPIHSRRPARFEFSSTTASLLLGLDSTFNVDRAVATSTEVAL
jgi:hypothetical protein